MKKQFKTEAEIKLLKERFYVKQAKIKKERVLIGKTLYDPAKPQKEPHKQQITHGALIGLGFTFKCRMYFKNGFSVYLDRHIWRVAHKLDKSADLVYLSDLIEKYKEWIGEPIN